MLCLLVFSKKMVDFGRGDKPTKSLDVNDT